MGPGPGAAVAVGRPPGLWEGAARAAMGHSQRTATAAAVWPRGGGILKLDLEQNPSIFDKSSNDLVLKRVERIYKT